MTTTLTDLINEVQINLAGYTYSQDRATHLRSAVTVTTSSSAAPTILSLNSTDNVGKGYYGLIHLTAYLIQQPLLLMDVAI